MSDNELLLALSDMLDKKLNAQLEPMKKDITDIKNEVQKIKAPSFFFIKNSDNIYLFLAPDT